MAPMSRSCWALPCLALFASAVCAGAPNIVVLFADDLGYGDLGVFGNPTIRTPNLDRLAAEGLRMTSFYSAPSCVPARVQLLLGRYPSRARVRGTSVGGKGGIPAEFTTLPQALRKVGYRTAMAGKWHLGYARPEHLPVGKGFDRWFGLPYSNDMIKPWVQTDEPLWLYRNAERVEHPVDQDQLTMRYTAEVVDVIREESDRPFFAYLAYSMPHLPLRTAGRFRGRSRAGLYGDVIEAIDWSAGEIMKALDDAGKRDDTIVVFTSDNGPWLNLPDRMLSGGVVPWHAGSPGPLRGAKHTTYEGGVRVPMVVRWPGTVPPGTVTAEMGATLDLYATLIAAGGGGIPEGSDGHDLTGLWAGRTGRSPRLDFIYHRGSQVQGVRSGPWKLRAVDGVELFHLDVDPSERYNVANEQPEIVAELRGRLERFRAQVEPQSGGAPQ